MVKRKSYTAQYEDALQNRFIKRLKESNSEAAAHLETIIAIETAGYTEKEQKSEYETFYESLTEDQQVALTEADAKRNDLCRRARVITQGEMLREHCKQANGHGNGSDKARSTADFFDYSIKQLRERNVEEDVVKKYIDENAVAMFSMTAHPTSPASLSYTKAALDLQKILVTDDASADELDAALDTVIAEQYTGKPKTTDEEVEEMLAIANSVYDASEGVYQSLRQALDKYGYRNIKIENPLIHLCTWRPGDGDGNPNATRKALETGIEKLRTEIKRKYTTDLTALISEGSPEANADIEKIIANLQKNIHEYSLEQFQEDIAGLGQKGVDVAPLQRKVNNFGFHYIKCDIRHNADDIMVTINRMIEKAGIEGTIEEILNDPAKVRALSELAEASLINDDNDKDGKTAARLLGRLRVVGENKDMSDKLIIAECKEPDHALAALLLMKATGNDVGNDQSKMDLVPLFESAPDLQNAKATVKKLLENDTFRAHVVARKQLMIQVAKSDTVRRNGRGAEFYQEQAGIDMFMLLEEMEGAIDEMGEQYPELKDVRVSIFHGGGAPIQRGGGRVTEMPHNVGRAAQIAEASRMAPATQTIQGHQNQILLSHGSVFETLCALTSQNLYAAIKLALGFIDPGIRVGEEEEHDFIEANKFMSLARENWKKGCDKALTVYQKGYVGNPDDYEETPGNPAFNILMENAAWVARKLANVSSRAMQRGGGQEDEDRQVTAWDLKKNKKGEAPKLLDYRSITVERICAHSGTHLVSILSFYEELKAIADNGGLPDNGQWNDPLHFTYDAYKTFRDTIRSTATALHMTDFNHAWHMLIGEDRPSNEEIIELSKGFDPNRTEAPKSDEENKLLCKQTLAWYEIYALNTAKLVYQTILGDEPPKDFTLKTPLEKAWPRLAEFDDDRNQRSSFARFVEAKLTNEVNNNPHMVLSENKQRIYHASYAAHDMTNNTPVGVACTYTRKIPGQGKSFVNEEAERACNIPRCLTAGMMEHMPPPIAVGAH